MVSCRFFLLFSFYKVNNIGAYLLCIFKDSNSYLPKTWSGYQRTTLSFPRHHSNNLYREYLAGKRSKRMKDSILAANSLKFIAKIYGFLYCTILKERHISNVGKMAEHFALLISPISIGIESIIKTFINSENLLLKVSLIFSIKGKIFLLLFIMNTSFQFYNPNQFQKYILTIVTQSFSIYI